jgi:hypothetical protein
MVEHGLVDLHMKLIFDGNVYICRLNYRLL